MLVRFSLGSYVVLPLKRCLFSSYISEYFEDFNNTERPGRLENVPKRVSIKFEIPNVRLNSKIRFNSLESVQSRSSKIRSSSSERYDKPRKYYENCKKIKLHRNMQSISNVTLAYIPLNCIWLGEERNFVQEFLLPWWYAFSERLHEIDVIDLSNVLIALRKIDNVTNGSVLARISHENLLTVVDCIFDSVTKLYPKTLATLLNSLQSLFANCNVEPDKNRLQNKIASALPIYINSMMMDSTSSKFGEDFDKYFDIILFKSAQIGVPKPSDKCVDDIVHVSSKLLSHGPVIPKTGLSSRNFSTMNYDILTSLNRLASAFILWKIDVGGVVPAFWPKWYQRTHVILQKSDGFTTATYLRNTILLALTFSHEKEFFRFIHRKIWMRKFAFNKSYLNFDDVLSMSGQIRQKLEQDNQCSNEERTFYIEILHELAGIV